VWVIRDPRGQIRATGPLAGMKRTRRPRDEFTNRIVLIGSAAQSLFDVTPTPLSCRPGAGRSYSPPPFS